MADDQNFQQISVDFTKAVVLTRTIYSMADGFMVTSYLQAMLGNLPRIG